MRLSKTLVPTLKEAPTEAEVPSHILMVRGGYLRKVAAGVYSFLPLGWRVIRKIMQIILRKKLIENIRADHNTGGNINPNPCEAIAKALVVDQQIHES